MTNFKREVVKYDMVNFSNYVIAFSIVTEYEMMNGLANRVLLYTYTCVRFEFFCFVLLQSMECFIMHEFYHCLAVYYAFGRWYFVDKINECVEWASRLCCGVYPNLQFNP